MAYSGTRLAPACLAVCLLVLLLRCSWCEGRKLLPVAEEERGGEEVMHFEGGLKLRDKTISFAENSEKNKGSLVSGNKL
ncbi:hypothetical protein E2562_009952 [Oryza meyeriana var. granulata]|uniref:Uncharacterized protein n=1 Tax=Oryza meyeriana var. granulata TaxID=110450 RepID=A0A6G1EIK1_9ORYZ|nr:hypothetical protein E2562_009952 [Oryza meyeriana var. granulata]